MAKKKRVVISEQPKQPYSNMGARKFVLMVGLALSVAAVALVALGAVNLLLIPNMFKSDKPLDIILLLLAAGAVVAFVALIFGVAGANASKPLARLSFFFSINAFIIGVGMLIVVLFIFKGVIPLPGLEGFLGGRNDAALFMPLP